MFKRKAKGSKVFFRVRCDGWLYLNCEHALVSDLEMANKYESLESAKFFARLFGRDEKFEVIENNNGKVIFHNVLEEAYNA